MIDEGLLAAVLADPENDSPRLIYADWLSENGQEERADFIRIQCRVAKLEAEKLFRQEFVQLADDAHELGRLRRRELELLTPFGWKDWAQPVPELIGQIQQAGNGFSMKCNWYLRRGFVYKVICSAAVWHQHADAILAEQPVREVDLTTVPRDWRALAGGERSFIDTLGHRWPGIKFDVQTTWIEDGVFEPIHGRSTESPPSE